MKRQHFVIYACTYCGNSFRWLEPYYATPSTICPCRDVEGYRTQMIMVFSSSDYEKAEESWKRIGESDV